jgi:hypothetical protein
VGVEKPDAELAPALGRLFSFKSDAIATKDAIERRRAILLGCGLLREEAEVKLATTTGDDGRERFATCFAVCGCHFGPDSVVQDKTGRYELRRTGIARPLTYSELQSEWMAQAIHNATSSSLEEGDLDETTVVQKLEKMQSVVANQQRGLQDAHSTCRLLHAEKRLLQAEVDEVRKRARHQRPTDTSSQAMQDGLGGEILRMRRALRDVPSDEFLCAPMQP